MRILILTVSYLPSTLSGARLIHDLAVEFLEQGHEVVVATPDETLASRKTIVRDDGMTVLRVRTGRIKGAPRILRALHEIRLSAVIWRRGRRFFRKIPCDLVVFYSPTIFFGTLVGRLKALWSCPSYLILRDIFPQWAVDAGLLRMGSLPYRFFRSKELAQYAAADVIGVEAPSNVGYFAGTGLDDGYLVEVLWHWSPLSHGELPATTFRRDWGLEDKVVFVYGGNIGVAQDMDNLIRLAHGLQEEPSIHILLLGDGSEVPRLRRVLDERALSNVSLRGPLDQKSYLAALSEFDVGLVTLDSRLRSSNFPGKTLGYMYCNLPILGSIGPGNDMKKVIEQHEAGLVTINGDDEGLLFNALALATDPEMRHRLGANGKRLLEESYSSKRAATQILAHFPERSGGHRAGSSVTWLG